MPRSLLTALLLFCTSESPLLLPGYPVLTWPGLNTIFIQSLIILTKPSDYPPCSPASKIHKSDRGKPNAKENQISKLFFLSFLKQSYSFFHQFLYFDVLVLIYCTCIYLYLPATGNKAGTDGKNTYG